MKINEMILDLLDHVEVTPCRMLLDTGSVRSTVPMLRGVWGRALRHIDFDSYAQVFEGKRMINWKGAHRTPLYIIRPAPEDPDFAPALDWILIGRAIQFESVLLRAWDVAAGMGMGTNREPFSIRQLYWLDNLSAMTSERQCWSLRQAAEAMRDQLSKKTGIRLCFNAPLRLLRHGNLIERPTFTDIATALTRRLVLLSNMDESKDLRGLVNEVAIAARRIASTPWQGQRSDLIRWSAAQHRELDMHGVVGSFELSEGAGNLWPLLVAGHWIHIGKATVFGLGQMQTSLIDA